MRTQKFNLRQIGVISAGNSAPAKDDFSTEGTPFIRASSLAFLTVGESIDKCEKVDKLIAEKNRLRLFPKHSVVFAKSGMSATLGRFYELSVDAYVVSHLAVIEPNRDYVNPTYLKYFLDKHPPFHLINDPAYPSIRLTDIEALEVDLPDLETQNKIVAVLNLVSEVLIKRQRSIMLYDSMMKSIFIEKFGDPVFNPKKWILDNLGSVVTKIEAGVSPVCEDIPRTNLSQLAVLKQSAVTKRTFLGDENKLLLGDTRTIKKVFATRGDLLISRKNTPDLVGASAYIFDDYENLLLPDTIFKLKYNSDKVSGVFLYFLFNDANFRKKVGGLRNGAAASMSNISQERLYSLQIPLPDIKLQHHFQNIVLSINEKQTKIVKSQQELLTLRASILQSAFNGQLNFNIDVELNSILKEIKLDRSSNDLSKITDDVIYLKRLLDMLNTQEITDKILYNKAKHVVFELLSSANNDRKIHQVYNDVTNSIELALK